MRFNAVSARRMMGKEPPDRPVAAACQPTGTPLMTPLLALALVEFARAGITDVDGMLRAMNTTAGAGGGCADLGRGLPAPFSAGIEKRRGILNQLARQCTS